jgi:hypothetical protein
VLFAPLVYPFLTFFTLLLWKEGVALLFCSLLFIDFLSAAACSLILSLFLPFLSKIVRYLCPGWGVVSLELLSISPPLRQMNLSLVVRSNNRAPSLRILPQAVLLIYVF